MKYYSLLLMTFLLIFCSDKKSTPEIVEENAKKYQPTKEFSNYWYDGTAEITSYKLSQYRYGEIHEGTAVNIFVTEPFLPKKQVKADYQNDKNIPILKLNSTKKFVTGIYPYSIMTSTFSPVNIDEQAIKISFSSQEWCGNTFAQLNNRSDFEIAFYSYFESNTDRKITLEKNILENEVWNLIRIAPEKLPIGNVKLIPSFEYLALNHRKIKAYDALTSLNKESSNFTYTINYTELNRVLVITFSNKAPYLINNWEETLLIKGKKYISKAEKVKTIKIKYWNKNQKIDGNFRDILGLK
ncbi:septum formation inhibitor Maf [Polaribacter porphyrae]|uniref:Septum formation inhibitor Maf n=1 Tax=Polaribacter porphyrae TaxID=1137780 RepID=A0A2S7WN85_9FLAO|nr:septum formation inhibitor Maf [Polaribacter porphyrae]PQJ79077.1 septum formation inhibitor Maf [Polaribacter porphyrae]